jgi:YVTN family beta-propeller protein|tara:strand:+ start:1810 stop:2874 length:1065 start_codon:yes stop_codon:yes gene_type:complete
MKLSHGFIALILLLAPLTGAAGETRQKLYVLSSAGNDVTVIDVATNAIIGSIEVGDRPHGIAAPRSQDVLYIATEFDNGLTVIDPVKDEVIKKYKIFGNRPNEIDVTSDGRFVYLPILGHGVYEVFDTLEEKIVARIATNGFPHNVVMSPDDRYAYLSPMDRGRTPAEAVAQGGFPTTLNEKIYVVDVSRHAVAATIPTGDAPRPIAISPNGKRLYVNTDGLQGFLVLDLDRREQVARVEYQLTEREKASPSRSHGMIATPDGDELWVSDVNHGLLFVFDVRQDPPRQLARLENGAPVYWLTVTPDGKTVYVSSAPGDVVTAFDVATRKKTATIQLPKGKNPKRLLVLNVPVGN